MGSPPSLLPDGFVEVRPESSDALAAAMGEEADRIAMRFARRCRAFAITVEGTVVSYAWLSTSTEWIGELGLEIAPADREAYVWNCFTLEAHRRRGHYRRVLEGIVSVARSEGLRRLWIGSVDVPAEKADEDAGFVRVLRFDVTVMGPERRLDITPVPDAPLRLVNAARAGLTAIDGWTHTGPVIARIH